MHRAPARLAPGYEIIAQRIPKLLGTIRYRSCCTWDGWLTAAIGSDARLAVGAGSFAIHLMIMRAA